MAISDLHNVDSSSVGILLNLVKPDVERATRRSSPAGHGLSAFVCTYYQTQSIMCWYSSLQGPGVQHGQTETSVDDVRYHQWLTNQIGEAPLHWRYELTSIIYQVSVADTSCGKPLVYSCRRPRGSIFLYLRAEQTLSVLGTGVLWC